MATAFVLLRKGVALRLPHCEGLGVPVIDGKGEFVLLALLQAVGLLLGHRDTDEEAEAQAVDTLLRLGVVVAHGLPLCEGLGLLLRSAERVSLALVDLQAEGLLLEQNVADTEEEELTVNAPLRLGEGVVQGL